MPTTTKGLPYPASTAAPNVPADVQALAEALDPWLPRYKRKATTENVTNSIVMQDDDELFLTLPVGAWRVEAFLHASGAAAADIAVSWVFTGTAALTHRACIGPGIATTSVTAGGVVRTSAHGLGTSSSYGLDGSASSVIHEDLLLVVTAPGTIKLQWTQSVASATATAVTSGSMIYATPMYAG